MEVVKNVVVYVEPFPNQPFNFDTVIDVLWGAGHTGEATLAMINGVIEVSLYDEDDPELLAGAFAWALSRNEIPVSRIWYRTEWSVFSGR